MSIVHAHLILNHVPVVGAVIGSLLLAYAVIRRNSEVGKIALALFTALAAVSVVVFLTGEPAEEAVEHLAGFPSSITEEHEELARVAMICTAAFGVLAFGALVYYRRRVLPRWFIASSLLVGLTISSLMAATANLGGQIRHSEIRAGAVSREVDEH
jgi:hypothetical protein